MGATRRSIFSILVIFLTTISFLGAGKADVRSWDIHSLPDRSQWLIITGPEAARLMNPKSADESAAAEELPRALKRFFIRQNWSDVSSVDSRILCGHKKVEKNTQGRNTASVAASESTHTSAEIGPDMEAVCVIALTTLNPEVSSESSGEAPLEVDSEEQASGGWPQTLFMNIEAYLSLSDQRAEALFHHPSGVPIETPTAPAIYDHKGLALPPHERRQVGPLLCGRIETEQPEAYSLTSFQGLEQRASNFFSIAERGSWEFGSKFTQYYCLLALKPSHPPVAILQQSSWSR